MNKAAVWKLSISMAIFGTIGFFSNLTDLPVLELIFLRCVCATVILLGYWLISGTYKKEKWDRREIGFILLSGVFLLLNWLLLFASFRKTSVTIAISIYNLAPLAALIINRFIFLEKIDNRIAGAAFAAFAGAVMISIQPGAASAGASGALLALGAAVFYGGIISLGRKIQAASSYMTTFLQTGIGIVMLIPFVQFSAYSGLSFKSIWVGLLTGVIHTGIVYLLFYDSIRFVNAGMVSVLVFIDPLVAILLDSSVTGFLPTRVQSSGIILIFFALGYTIFRSSQRSKKELSG